MNLTEDEIWDYIDGNGTTESLAATAANIETDPVYATLYEELLAVHQQLASIDLEEPSMSFSRNVMEAVKTAPAPVRLRTRVDKRIIYAFATFFIAAIAVMVTYILSGVRINPAAPELHIDLRATASALRTAINPTVIKIFLFVDMLLAFVYLDILLRRRRKSAIKN